MKEKQIADRLEALLGHEINDWDKDELSEKLSRMGDRPRRVIMKHIGVIWPVSYALFLAFADRAEAALDCLGDEEFPDWVAALLDVYEADGLHRAVLFMDNVEGAFLCRVRGEAGLLFEEIDARLLQFARCASGHEVTLAPAPFASTTLANIYLPKQIAVFPSDEKNFLLYKFTLTFLIGLEKIGTFSLPELSGELAGFVDGQRGSDTVEFQHNPLDRFFSTFAVPHLAQDIFYVLEAFRVIEWLAEEYPGLMKDVEEVLQHFFVSDSRESSSSKRSFVCFLQRLLVAPDKNCEKWSGWLEKTRCRSVEESLLKTAELYRHCEQLTGQYDPPPPLPFMGELRCQTAYDEMEKRREGRKDTFIEALSEIIAVLHNEKIATVNKDKEPGAADRNLASEDGVLLLLEVENGADEGGDRDELSEGNKPSAFLTIGNGQIDLPDDIAQMVKDIQSDLGAVPEEYISSAYGRSGAGKLPDTYYTGVPSGTAVCGPVVYDEWDFRRAGFRKSWCRLLEKEIIPTKGTFFETTLEKYRGQLVRLRKQFEAMVVQENFVRRQRDGNDIDLDAVMDSLADKRAGFSPSERLFVRLQRNDRNIAALFLVDMSNSTEGWVGKALKESLILMCESLDVLGDRYAIYGFSGMRRSRSEFFTIKSFTDCYNDEIKGKISAITPKEYTRMGPAIRHAAKILDGVDAKVRLLITLSDGKPEDYDDYKGVYAIEDTRHALIESKSRGIHPFCITVDKESQDYMAHMYGEVNYIFIDDVTKLPARIPQIYRNLTT